MPRAGSLESRYVKQFLYEGEVTDDERSSFLASCFFQELESALDKVKRGILASHAEAETGRRKKIFLS
jgi:hypothetical protein